MREASQLQGALWRRHSGARRCSPLWRTDRAAAAAGVLVLALPTFAQKKPENARSPTTISVS